MCEPAFNAIYAIDEVDCMSSDSAILVLYNLNYVPVINLHHSYTDVVDLWRMYADLR